MRIRFIVLALLTVAAGACAMPADGTGQTGVAAPATTAPGPATTTQKSPARRPPPPGIIPVARRKPAPSLRVAAFDGRTVTLDGLQGRPVVVSFFESWCEICQIEQPDLTKVATEFDGRAGFVGISYHDTVAAGRAYQRRFKVPYPLANDPSGKTWARWGVPYQPVVVLVDTKGRVAERFDGGTTGGTLHAALVYLTSE
jgi:peroxiredoxin